MQRNNNILYTTQLCLNKTLHRRLKIIEFWFFRNNVNQLKIFGFFLKKSKKIFVSRAILPRVAEMPRIADPKRENVRLREPRTCDVTFTSLASLSNSNFHLLKYRGERPKISSLFGRQVFPLFCNRFAKFFCLRTSDFENYRILYMLLKWKEKRIKYISTSIDYRIIGKVISFCLTPFLKLERKRTSFSTILRFGKRTWTGKEFNLPSDWDGIENRTELITDSRLKRTRSK